MREPKFALDILVFKKIIFQNRYVALETPSRPPPFMANTILNFHFDYLHPSLIKYYESIIFMAIPTFIAYKQEN